MFSERLAALVAQPILPPARTPLGGDLLRCRLPVNRASDGLRLCLYHERERTILYRPGSLIAALAHARIGSSSQGGESRIHGPSTALSRHVAGQAVGLSAKRELLAGDIVEVRSRVLEVGEKSLRFLHEMWNIDARELAASCESTGVHMDRRERKGSTIS